MTPDEWISATASACDELRSQHGFESNLFVVVGPDTHVHLQYDDDYPSEWEVQPDTSSAVRVRGLVKRESIPDGLVLFQVPDSQCTCCPGDGFIEHRDPIVMLKSLKTWDKNRKRKIIPKRC